MASAGGSLLFGEGIIRLRLSDRIGGLGAFQNRIARIGAAVRNTGFGLVGLGAGLAAPLGAAIREFSRIEQLQGRFNAVFRGAADEARAFAKTFADSINQSIFVVQDQLAIFAADFQGLGFTLEQSLDLSKLLTELTNDVIAFDDTIRDPLEALQRLQSTLVGESRAARQLRIGADTRDIELTKVLEERIGKTARNAEEAERRLARLRIVLKAGAGAGLIGQAVRETNTLAALLRGLRGEVSETFNALGAAIQTPVRNALRGILSGLRQFQEIVLDNGGRVRAVAAFTAALLTAGGAAVFVGLGLQLVGFAFSGLLAPVNLLTVAFRGIFAAASVTAILGPLGQVALLIGGVTTAVVLLRNNWQSVQQTITAGLADLQQRFQLLAKGIGDALAAGNIQLAAQILFVQLELAFVSGTNALRKQFELLAVDVSAVLLAISQQFNSVIGRAQGFGGGQFNSARFIISRIFGNQLPRSFDELLGRQTRSPGDPTGDELAQKELDDNLGFLSSLLKRDEQSTKALEQRLQELLAQAEKERLEADVTQPQGAQPIEDAAVSLTEAVKAFSAGATFRGELAGLIFPSGQQQIERQQLAAANRQVALQEDIKRLIGDVRPGIAVD